MLSMYYVVIFCNIYLRSVDSLFQIVYLSIFLDMVVIKIGLTFIQAILRSFIKVLSLRYILI